MGDTLLTLQRLRRLTLDQARRGLAECLRGEAVAETEVRALVAEIDQQTRLVSEATGDDRMVEEFAAWLRRIRPMQAAADDALLTAQTRTAEARAVLGAARAAVEATDALIAQRSAERAVAANRREQSQLDEAGRRRSGPAAGADRQGPD